ncbi:serine/threonine protein kinase [Desulfosarcina cetonica]|uniref:serine/threonine protein kinase n=1 Tax=Desulfosarcina cetonica TaxID=90730 RepID=UPI0006CFF917|nr:serine/threonine-protein kinase [Desulfosarcina cetonica]
MGDRLDIFILRSELHQGVMAVLFLAEDPFSGKKVVIKIPSGDILNQPIVFYHYQNEDRISRVVDHPAIIGFIHRRRSRQYIIMEHVPGHDLRTLVGRNRKLPLDKALAMMEQLCDGMEYLHRRGIVHLDLKPENIIVTGDHRLKVIDFGLASCRSLPDLLALDLRNPQGTPWYIAPEQLLGVRDDPRCDIYSMGLLFYEMLTGELPWPRSSKLTTARRRLKEVPIPPRHFNPDIPPQIQDIIIRALAVAPDERYRSCGELRKDLKRWRELPVTPSGTNTRPPSFLSRIFATSGRKGPSGTAQSTYPQPGRPKIIGGFIDAAAMNDMVNELKKQALIHDAEIFMVHVIEDESDSHVTRYGKAVEGEKLMVGLEQAIGRLRSCDLDPSVRLIHGEVVKTLQTVCTEPQVLKLIIGKSRKKDGLLRSASVKRRLLKEPPCPVTIVEAPHFSPLDDLGPLHPGQLARDQVLDCDIFFVDLWYEHLHYHTEFIYQHFLFRNKTFDPGREKCVFGRWLRNLAPFDQWREIVSILGPTHEAFHRIDDEMIACCEQDPGLLRRLYQQKSLPLAYRLKLGLAEVSRVLRSHLDPPPPTVPFLVDIDSPVAFIDRIGYGPLLNVINLDQDLCALAQKEGFPSVIPEAAP